MPFTLPQGYKVPKKPGSFFKPEQGENRVRILASPVIGNIAWVDGPDGSRTPIRVRQGASFTTDVDSEKIKHFWALPVWNYAEKRVQVWEITQSTILGQLTEFNADEDWGDPTGYDIAVKRTGEQLKTEYSVIAKPKTPLAEEAAKAWDQAIADGFDLERMFTTGKPFGDTREKPSDDWNDQDTAGLPDHE